MSLKISIITPSFNQGRFIRDTIESVLNQNYSNFEHIVIDGGSTDETIDILKSFPHLKWVSEPDSGAANAINKGFSMVRGDVLTWLNSDDYFENNIFKYIEELFLKYGLDKIIIGSLTWVDANKQLIGVDKNHRITREFLIHKNADLLRQPCMFYSTDLFRKSGGLNESLRLVFDYELFIKMLSLAVPIYVDKNLAYQRDYPETLSRSLARRQAIEIFKVSRRNGGRIFDKINLRIIKKLIFRK